MSSYKELYFYLFGALAQAAEYLEQGNTFLAYQSLITAQQNAEEACLEFDLLPEQ